MLEAMGGAAARARQVRAGPSTAPAAAPTTARSASGSTLRESPRRCGASAADEHAPLPRPSGWQRPRAAADVATLELGVRGAATGFHGGRDAHRPASCRHARASRRSTSSTRGPEFKARASAPMQGIDKEFFQNRAALKMAAIDAACDYALRCPAPAPPTRAPSSRGAFATRPRRPSSRAGARPGRQAAAAGDARRRRQRRPGALLWRPGGRAGRVLRVRALAARPVRQGHRLHAPGRGQGRLQARSLPLPRAAGGPAPVLRAGRPGRPPLERQPARAARPRPPANRGRGAAPRDGRRRLRRPGQGEHAGGGEQAPPARAVHRGARHAAARRRVRLQVLRPLHAVLGVAPLPAALPL